MADLIDRAAAFLVLRKAQITSCTCQIKTPDPDWHNHNCRYRILREIEAMIEHLPDADAISALPAQGVRVRALEWCGPSGDPEPWESYGWEQYAKSVAGTYRVLNRNGLWRAVIHRVENADFIAETDTLDAAKATAQADYERRILAALAPAEAGGVEAHVNGTPKSEHDAGDVLTPAPVDALVKAAEAFDVACSNNAHGKTVWTGHHFIDAKELKAAWEATRAALAAIREGRG